MSPSVQPVTHRHKLYKIIYTGAYTRFVFLHLLKFNIYKYRRVSYGTFYRKLAKYKNLVLYFDHSLGGGTAVYSDRRVKELSKNHNVVVCQYDGNIKRYIFSCNNDRICMVTADIDHRILELFSHIIVNNLVGYKEPLGIIERIADAKNKNPALRVEFMVHDFFCICPGIHLFKPDLTSCVKNNRVNCIACQSYPGFPSIDTWRGAWEKFLVNTVNDITVFSESSRKILLSMYPSIEPKIKVIPHTVPPMRKVKIGKHENINIGVVGNLNPIKGRAIVCNMAQMLPKNVNIVCIGSFTGNNLNNSQFICAGGYDLDDLPDIIEKHKIDIALIPSVVPETFSFTTSECMNMGLPVACFDIGAPAERVSKYEYGLIISKIDAKIALKEILNFVNKIKNGSLNE